jgi:hypothetical protein
MAPRRIIAGALLAVALLALSACGNGLGGQPTPTPTTAPVEPTPTTAPVEPTPTTAAPAETTIVFETSGGIAGVMKRMEINPKGEATLTDQRMGRPGVVTPIDVDRYGELLGLIDKSDFFNLKDEYNSGTVADDFIYTVTVTQDGRTKSVVVYDVGGRDLAPQPLLDLVDRLKAIQDQIEKSG